MMAMMLKQSTAVDVLIGPFVDITNGATAESGETPTVKLSKNGQTLAAKSDVTVPVHDADGYYNCELDATDTNTVGTLVLTVAASATALPVRHEFQVVAANVYDSLYAASGTDILQVETTTNSDKTGYSISGTKTTLDALNDVAATDIVSSGAITTSGGAVSNVTLVATTTTNTDMRGTDNAYLAANAPTDSRDQAITASTGRVTVGTNNDKTGYSISGSKTTLDALNDVAATDIVSSGAITTSAGAVSNVTLVATTTTNTDMRGTDGANTTTPPTSAQIADAVWDESLGAHTTAGSTGKALKQIKEGIISVESSVNDLSSTTTTFVTSLTETTDGFYQDKVIVFISGTLTGQARHIDTYVGSTKSITVSKAFTSAPANADEFLILAIHEYGIDEIQAGLSTSAEIAALNDLSTTDILGMAYEGSEDFQDFLRLMRAVLLGKTTGAGTGTENFRDAGDTKNRVVSSIDANGDRTAITTDAT